MSLLPSAVILLAAALISVPLSRWLGFGSVLGYLAAGLLLGPFGFGAFEDVESILHLAEFGVIMLLFVIGLELQPSRLWLMRTGVFGLGGLQVLMTAGCIAPVVYALGLSPTASVIVGLTFAASSTAMALQILAERKELASVHGRSAFSIVLFQDIIAIPLIALIPVIGAGSVSLDNGGGLDALIGVGKAMAVLVGFLVIGRLLLAQVLRLIAHTEIPEMFTAMALFTVVGSAWLMDLAGLSMALGAFLAGVLLAESEYRHEMEANIEPFKGLLMSLFFMAIGMGINLGLLLTEPGRIMALVVALIALKGAIIFTLGRFFKLRALQATKLAVVLSQAGEFGFVFLSLSSASGILTRDQFDLMTMVVSLSMASTPLLMKVQDLILGRRPSASDDPVYEVPEQKEQHVVIAGMGRVGQITGRILRARGIPFTALEPNVEQVELARGFGNPVYYGDPARLDLLRAARVQDAITFVLTIPDPEHSLKVAETVRRHFPHVPIIARARNRQHAHELMEMGVMLIERETLHSSLVIARHVLAALGLSEKEAGAIIEKFREHDQRHLMAARPDAKDMGALRERARRSAEELADILSGDLTDGD